MGKERKHYTKQFKLDAIALYESSGKTAAEIERNLSYGTRYLIADSTKRGTVQPLKGNSSSYSRTICKSTNKIYFAV